MEKFKAFIEKQGAVAVTDEEYRSLRNEVYAAKREQIERALHEVCPVMDAFNGRIGVPLLTSASPRKDLFDAGSWRRGRPRDWESIFVETINENCKNFKKTLTECRAKWSQPVQSSEEKNALQEVNPDDVWPDEELWIAILDKLLAREWGPQTDLVLSLLALWKYYRFPTDNVPEVVESRLDVARCELIMRALHTARRLDEQGSSVAAGVARGEGKSKLEFWRPRIIEHLQKCADTGNRWWTGPGASKTYVAGRVHEELRANAREGSEEYKNQVAAKAFKEYIYGNAKIKKSVRSERPDLFE